MARITRALALGLSGLLWLSGCAQPGTASLLGVDPYQASGTKGPRPAGAPEWTIFVYMAGDNDLSEFVDQDLNEMEAGLRTDKVKVIALVDQDKRGDSRIVDVRPDPAGMNDRLVSAIVDDRGAVIPPNKEVNTGDPATLERFINWGIKNYPAKRMMFVPWNHGGGAFDVKKHLKSFCWDDNSNSNLNLVDFWRVAQRVSSRAKFDIIGFDMCLLGHVETAWQLRDLGDFLVSAETIEPGDGWDYEAVMRSISRNPSMSPREFAAEITRGFNAYYTDLDEESTISAMDLQKVKNRLVPAINQLARELRVTSQQSARVRNNFISIAKKAAKLSSAGDGEEMAVDLGLLGGMLAQSTVTTPAIRTLAAQMVTELQRATVSNLTSNMQPGVYNGLKVYLDPKSFDPAYRIASHQSFGTSEWANLLAATFATASR